MKLTFVTKSLLFASTVAATVAYKRNSSEVKTYGVLLFQDVQLQDIAGPIDPLQLLARSREIDIFTIAPAPAGNVPTIPYGPTINTYNSSASTDIVADYTFETAPRDIDVLIVPGGAGVHYLDTSDIEAFIRDRYPSLQYLVTVCTGAGIAARSGVLDGRRATTNKAAWNQTTAYGPNVNWVSPARWIVDGNIWTSSGVTSGIDLIFSFIETVHGKAIANRISHVVEYQTHERCWDPYAAYFNVTPTAEKC